MCLHLNNDDEHLALVSVCGDSQVVGIRMPPWLLLAEGLHVRVIERVVCDFVYEVVCLKKNKEPMIWMISVGPA